MTKKIVLISTGGTIEKSYDKLEGILHNDYNVLDIILADLVLDHIELERISLMNKDSLHMTEEDHQLIAQTALTKALECDGVVIVHGTDRLSVTGETILRICLETSLSLKIPIVLTGAMIPYMLRNSDALQNITEALIAVQISQPGIYCVLHNQILKFPGVIKNKQLSCFMYKP